MKIGSYKGWSSRNFKGLIDEVCIWNRSLTQEEIREHRHLTHYLAQDPTIYAYYQFNESESIIYDKIAARNTTFNGTSVRSTSTAPVGGGTVGRLNIASGGNYDFAPAGVQLDFSATGTSPSGEVLAFQLNVPPDVAPTNAIIPQNGYYIVNNYGTNSAFSALNSLTFGNTTLTELESENPQALDLSLIHI